MNPGEAFEIACCEYLVQNYSTVKTHFHREGGMDSTMSDIAVIQNDEIQFFIEAKDHSAHSGQFVLLPDENTRTFLFSPKNKSLPNPSTDLIIAYMNADFDKFHHAGTAGAAIDLDPSIFSKWIIKHYQQKKVKYVITDFDGYVILPIEKFAEYFKIGANYRIKKSGSHKPAKRDLSAICDIVRKDYPTAQIDLSGQQLFVSLKTPLRTDTFTLGGYTYLFSPRSPERYEIRRLSNTYHMNVLLTIEAKKAQEEADLSQFTAEL